MDSSSTKPLELLRAIAQASAASTLEQATGAPLNNLKNWRQTGSYPPLTVRNLYKGASAGVAGILPISISQMALYELLVQSLGSEAPTLTQRSLCAIGGGSLTALGFGGALEALLLKTSLAAREAELVKRPAPSPWDLLRKTQLSALYRASWLCSIRDAAFTVGYKTGSELIDPHKSQRPLWIQVAVSGIAGAGAGVVTHPLDTLRTQVLLNPKEQPVTVMIDGCKKLGLRGLMRGAVHRVPRAGIFAAIYEIVCKYTLPSA